MFGDFNDTNENEQQPQLLPGLTHDPNIKEMLSSSHQLVPAFDSVQARYYNRKGICESVAYNSHELKKGSKNVLYRAEESLVYAKVVKTALIRFLASFQPFSS